MEFEVPLQCSGTNYPFLLSLSMYVTCTWLGILELKGTLGATTTVCEEIVLLLYFLKAQQPIFTLDFLCLWDTK